MSDTARKMAQTTLSMLESDLCSDEWMREELLYCEFDKHERELATIRQQVAGLQSDLEREMVRYTEVEEERNELRRQVERLEQRNRTLENDNSNYLWAFNELQRLVKIVNPDVEESAEEGDLSMIIECEMRELSAYRLAAKPAPTGQPVAVAWQVSGPYERSVFKDESSAKAFCKGLNEGYGEDAYSIAPLYTAPPAQARPIELEVWFDSMPESNGKANWTAILYRKDAGILSGVTIARSEYPDRVRYEADKVRYLIGELGEEPDILAYDADLHSGYVDSTAHARQVVPVVPDGWKLMPIEPTEQMLIAMAAAPRPAERYSISREAYKAALTAAPAAQEQEKPE